MDKISFKPSPSMYTTSAKNAFKVVDAKTISASQYITVTLIKSLLCINGVFSHHETMFHECRKSAFFFNVKK